MSACPTCGVPATEGAAGGPCARCLVELALTPEEHAPEAGLPSKLFGPYVLNRRLGAGGMGVVYEALHVQTGSRVALKLMRDSQGASPTLLRRFAIEAEAAARLDHPNIVRIYEVGEFEGQPFVSMELIEGESLEAKLARGAFDLLSNTDAAASQLAMARLLWRLARAVQHAHERGVLHRDLKPGNILLDTSGEPRLTDFGLAKILSPELAEHESRGLTRTGEAAGTPRYMSPEQASGAEPSEASDVYGLGGVLYALLTGRPPFAGAAALELFQQIAQQSPVKPRMLNPRIHADLETICLKCLEKEPSQRYRTAAAVAEDLQAFLEQRPIQGRRAGVLYRSHRWIRRNPVGAALMATLCVGLCVALFLLHVVNEQRREIELDRDQTFDDGMQKISQLWRESSTRSVTISARELAILDGRSPAELRGAPHQLTLGVGADDSPASMAQRYARWLGAWQNAMGRERTVNFDLRIFKHPESSAEFLRRGEIDLLVMNAADFVRAHAQRPPLEALAQIRGSREGVIFAHTNSGVTKLATLRGRSIALPDSNSILSIMATARLVEAGLKQDDLTVRRERFEPSETSGLSLSTTAALHRLGGHGGQALERVLRGEADAGVSYRAPFERHRHLGLVSLERITETPHVLATRSDLPSELKSALQHGLRAGGGAPKAHDEPFPFPFHVPVNSPENAGLEASLQALRNAIRTAAEFSQ